MGAYQVYQTTPPDAGGLAPTALSNPAGQALENALGSVKDYLVDKAKMAAKTGMPLVAPPDALSKIGIERQLLRGPGETDAQFALRCQNAWQTWPFAGTAYGLLLALSNLGYPNVYLLPVRGPSSILNGPGTGVTTAPQIGGAWKIDSNAKSVLPVWSASADVPVGAQYFPDTRNSFWYTAAVGGLTGSTPPAWPTTVGQSVVDNAVTWSCSGLDLWSRFDLLFSPVPASWNPTPPASTADEINRIRVVIAQWIPAFAICNRLIALVSGLIWGFPASQVWGAGTGNWGPASVTYYSP